MGSNQQFSLKWTNYTNHITNAFDSLRSKEDFCDVTLSCEGRKIRAHKVLLSACSSYFKDIFKENPCQHPVIIFRNVKYDDLLSIVVYMYQGEVNIEQESLPTFLHTAEMLSIQGLTDDDDKHHKSDINAPTALTSVAAAAVAAVSAPVAVQQAIPVPVTMHAQTLPKDTRLRSSHTKITMAKHQPISLLSTTTPGEQVLFTAMAAPPVSIVQGIHSFNRTHSNIHIDLMIFDIIPQTRCQRNGKSPTNRTLTRLHLPSQTRTQTNRLCQKSIPIPMNVRVHFRVGLSSPNDSFDLQMWPWNSSNKTQMANYPTMATKKRIKWTMNRTRNCTIRHRKMMVNVPLVRICILCSLCFVSISVAEDKDAGDFDKPNIATQAELGTCIQYLFGFIFCSFSVFFIFLSALRTPQFSVRQADCSIR